MDRMDLLRKTLVLLNKHDSDLADEMRELERSRVIAQEVNFSQLEAAHLALIKLVREHRFDFLLFAQNDQVLDKKDIGDTIRALRTGYSSFSGIDDSMYLEQTRRCLKDLMAGEAYPDFLPGNTLQSARQPGGKLGFSLIFDTEQMGGVRFGLPRILDVLEAYQTPSTFFVTGFVAAIYPDLLRALRDRGHSIGIHGHYHEYLSDLELADQTRRLETEKAFFERHTPVKGANFFLRMNADTVKALVAAGFDYFVVSMEHIYSPFAYRKMPVRPFRVWTAEGEIWMVPVSVETYNRPPMAVRLAVDSAIYQAKLEKAPAVNVLMHPFRDGSLRHVDALEKLLKYLQARPSLVPTTIEHVIEHLPKSAPSAYIYVTLGDGEMAGYGGLPKNGVSNWQWHDFAKYWQRVGHLYTSLKQLGHTPALCLSCPKNTTVFAVYPYLPDTRAQVVSLHLDPIACKQGDSRLLPVLDQHTSNGANKTVVFRPGSLGDAVKSAYATLHPRQASDWWGLFPEVATRFVSYVTGYRHIY